MHPPTDWFSGRFRDRNVIVTGAASGIGRAVALRFAREGARVAAWDRSPEGLRTLEQEFGEPPHHFSTVCDVAQEEEVRFSAEDARNRFKTIHVLFNAAGIGMRSPVTETSSEDWDRCFDINVRGTFLCSKYVIPAMPSGASIIHTASVTGLTGVRNRAAYGSTKGAIISLTRNMALDYAHRGIRVNCICPGFVKTPLIEALVREPERAARLASLHPLGRLGEPEEIAAAALFLASDEAGWITGQAIAVDGGFTAGVLQET